MQNPPTPESVPTRSNRTWNIVAGIVGGVIAYIASAFLIDAIIPYDPIVHLSVDIFAVVMSVLFGYGVYRWLQLPPDQRR